MKKEDKKKIIKKIADTVKEYENFYLTDIATLDAAKTSKLRRECFEQDIKLMVVKNTLMRKALESLDESYEELYPLLKGNTAAYVQESFFIGDKYLKELVSIKSKTELIGEIIALLQSPAKNVISALQSSGNTLHGILKALSEK